MHPIEPPPLPHRYTHGEEEVQPFCMCRYVLHSSESRENLWGGLGLGLQPANHGASKGNTLGVCSRCEDWRLVGVVGGGGGGVGELV